MFNSNAFPPPTSFGHEHRPLRLTSESARSHPQGGCHFQPVPRQSQRCLCQSFQHDRSAPGNVCDCGHSACYHSYTNSERRISPDRIVSLLVEKVKKLEDAMVTEREVRDSLLARERQAWEREVRVLREALAPFYRSEQDMTRRLLEVEGKVDVTQKAQMRLRDRLSVIDDASFIPGQTSDNNESYRSRKRKASLTQERHELISPELNDASSNSDASSISQISPQSTSPVGEHSFENSGSMHRSPPSGPFNKIPSAQVVSGPSVLQYHHHHHHHKQQLPSPESEPRSSGFLSIDLTERVRRHKPSPPSRPKQELPPLPSINRGLPSPPQALQHKAVTGMLPVSELLSKIGCRPAGGPDSRSLKKRKQQNGIMALDVLANVTVASPLAH